MRTLKNIALMLVSSILLSTVLLAQTPFPDLGREFEDDVVPRVDILLPADSLAEILAEGNELSNYEYPATLIIDDGDERDTIQDIGFRLRGNTSRFAEKKSFKVSLNTYEQGRKWKDLEKINLNGEHNDPSVTRSKLCWDLLRQVGIPAPRANHVELYINGDYFGLYANVEQIDEEFVQLRFGNNDGNLYKCTYPADLDYLGNDPDAYKLTSNGDRVYELLTNKDEDDYSDLANFIDVLNNSSIADLPCNLEAVFNVDDFLRVMAFDVLAGNWDGPLFNLNNFYLYLNEATGKFEYIPFDLDNTYGVDFFSVDWGNRNIYSWAMSSNPHPLYSRIIAIQDYRDRYTYYLRTFAEGILSEGALFSYLDEMQTKIAPFVTTDTYYPLDYGFTFDDFVNSFDGGTDYSHTPYSIKEYISTRNTSALNQLENNDMAPIVTKIIDNAPSPAQSLVVQAKIEDDVSITQVQLCYQVNGAGGFDCVAMNDEAQNGDALANDGKYTAMVPAIGSNGFIDYYILAEDDAGQESRKPVCDNLQTTVLGSGLTLAINELMASNDETIADAFGEFDDWVEIHNFGDNAINLSGLYLSDNPNEPTKWPFPNETIAAGEFLLIWADGDEDQGIWHANFRLASSGETVGIYDTDANDNALIDGVTFGDLDGDEAYGRIPNGVGLFQLLVPTPAGSNIPLTSVLPIPEVLPLKLSPNPFQDVVSLELGETSSEDLRLQLFDAQGRALGQQLWPAGQPNFSWTGLSELLPGVYFLGIQQNGQWVNWQKIVRE